MPIPDLPLPAPDTVSPTPTGSSPRVPSIAEVRRTKCRRRPPADAHSAPYLRSNTAAHIALCVQNLQLHLPGRLRHKVVIQTCAIWRIKQANNRDNFVAAVGLKSQRTMR